MPKLSLKRRHRRQHDLCLLQRSTAECLNRENAARMVSDEDIQLSKEALRESKRRYSEDSVISLSPSQTISTAMSLQGSEVLGLKGHLGNNSSQTLDNGFSCFLSPKGVEKTPQHPSCGTSSPWGQFVDMVVPVSVSSDEDFEDSPHSSTCDNRRFLPFCPSPASATCSSRHHPYHRHTPKRQRILGHRRTKSTDMKGFILQVPGDSKSPSTDIVVETQTAFEGLRF